jgi:hypothetical protein
MIEPGRHSKQFVDTRDGTVKIVDSPSLSGQTSCAERIHKNTGRLRVKARTDSLPQIPALSPTSTLSPQLDVPFQLMPYKPDLELDNNAYVYVPVGNGLYRKEPKQKSPPQQYPSLTSDSSSASTSSLGLPAKHEYENGGRDMAPLIIAPMTFDGASFADLGLPFDQYPENASSQSNPEEDDELRELQNLLNSQGPYDVYYAASCVIPGQCECGDSCTCEGCPTHDPNVLKDKVEPDSSGDHFAAPYYNSLSEATGEVGGSTAG